MRPIEQCANPKLVKEPMQDSYIETILAFAGDENVCSAIALDFDDVYTKLYEKTVKYLWGNIKSHSDFCPLEIPADFQDAVYWKENEVILNRYNTTPLEIVELKRDFFENPNKGPDFHTDVEYLIDGLAMYDVLEKIVPNLAVFTARKDILERTPRFYDDKGNSVIEDSTLPQRLAVQRQMAEIGFNIPVFNNIERKDGTQWDKGEEAVRLGMQVLIDDSIQNCEKFLKKSDERGRKTAIAFHVSRPYNRLDKSGRPFTLGPQPDNPRLFHLKPLQIPEVIYAMQKEALGGLLPDVNIQNLIQQAVRKRSQQHLL